MASKLKPIDYSGFTYGELTAMYVSYSKVFYTLMDNDDKELLPRVIERMSAINKARKDVTSSLQDYFHNMSDIELAIPNLELNSSFYDKFIEDWDSDRCDQYFKTMGSFTSECTPSVRKRQKMLNLLGL